MKIKSLRLQNFLSFGDEPQEFDFSSETIIVGPNNAGKTNVFRAIELVSNLFQDRLTVPEIYYHDFNFKKSFEIEIKLDFNEDEIRALTNYLVCSNIHENITVDSGDNQDAALRLIKNLMVGHGMHYFAEFCKNISVVVSNEGRKKSRPKIFLRIHQNKKNLYYSSSNLTKTLNSPRSYTVFSLPRILITEFKSKYTRILSDYLSAKDNPLPDLNELRKIPVSLFDDIYELLPDDGSAQFDFGGFRLDDFENRYDQDFDEISELRDFVRIHSGTDAEGYNFVSLIGLIFNNSFIKTQDIRSKPSSILSSLNPERIPGIINIDGHNMASTLFSLRNSEHPRDKLRYNQILNAFHELTGFYFDVILREKNKSVNKEELVFVPHSTDVFQNDGINVLGIKKTTTDAIQYDIHIQIIKNDIPIPLEFAAAGFFETILILTAIIGYENKIILLDEPALNLHPTAQKRILQLIEAAVQNNHNQTITITHSPFMISSEKIMSIWKIAPSVTGSKIMNFGRILQDMTNDDQAKIVKNFRNSDIRSILFQRGIIFVEGPTDKVVIEKINHFLSETTDQGSDLESNEWSTLEIGGKKSGVSFVQLAQNLEIPFVMVFDYDALMHCEDKIISNGMQFKTSTVFSLLSQTVGLSTENINYLKSIVDKQEKIQISAQNNSKPQKQCWYSQSLLSKLQTIAKSYDIFVFTKDIEGVMQSFVSKKDSKPLKALDKINELISNNTIPEEFYRLEHFLKNKICGNT